MQHPLNQTAPRRAWEDTWDCLLNRKIGFGVGVVVIGAIAAIFIPSENTVWLLRLLYGALGAIIGLVIVFICVYIFFFIRAPYKQRNEARALLDAKPKPITLLNRDALFDAMAEVKLALVDVVANVKDLRLKRQSHIMFTQPGRWNDLDRIDTHFRIAYEVLQKEIFSAGSAFEPTLNPLLVCISGAFSLDDSSISQLESLIVGTRNKIDQLSQPTLDKEDSQKK